MLIGEPQMDETRRRAQGTLLGLACGDVLGCPVKGWGPFRIRQAFDVLRDVCEPFDVSEFLEDRPFRDATHARWMVSQWRLPGIYSDDTQQALLLVHSLAGCRGLDTDDVRRRFVEASQPCDDESCGLGVFRGYGKGFRASMLRLVDGVPIEQSGAPSAGNGAAVRIAPVGFFFRDDVEEAARKVVEVSCLTHREVRGLCAAVMVAYVVAEMARRTPPVRADALLYDVIDFCRWAEDMIVERLGDTVVCDDRLAHQFSEAVERVDGLWRVDAIEAVDRIGEHASD
ncbi:ADP-ribosylglycohydrolase family protein, partial [bacterium]|nr:ADP-ribosylglycohydrolase family protein [bacterium]